MEIAWKGKKEDKSTPPLVSPIHHKLMKRKHLTAEIGKQQIFTQHSTQQYRLWKLGNYFA